MADSNEDFPDPVRPTIPTCSSGKQYADCVVLAWLGSNVKRSISN